MECKIIYSINNDKMQVITENNHVWFSLDNICNSVNLPVNENIISKLNKNGIKTFDNEITCVNLSNFKTLLKIAPYNTKIVNLQEWLDNYVKAKNKNSKIKIDWNNENIMNDYKGEKIMNNKISKSYEIFKNIDFGEVRTVFINNTIYFVATDVAKALGYSNPQKAIRDHVDEEDKRVNELFTPSGTQKAIIINESGLYSLIMSSKLPKAKEFKHWITNEVLPAIRKSGTYNIEESTREIDNEIEKSFDNTSKSKSITHLSIINRFIDISNNQQETDNVLSLLREYNNILLYLEESKSSIAKNNDNNYDYIHKLESTEQHSCKSTKYKNSKLPTLVDITLPNIKKIQNCYFYSATDIANETNVTSILVGKIAILNELKTDKYGEFITCEKYKTKVFRYNQLGHDVLIRLIEEYKKNK